jgi:hypothetical protein
MSLDSKKEIIPLLLLIARPAAGKSEIIHYLKGLETSYRKKQFHLGKLQVIDDFPFLWRWFEEDHILSEMGKDRLYSDKDGYFKYLYQWDLLINLINLEYKKFLRDKENPEDYSVILEFSRGKQHGGYKRAFEFLSNEIIKTLSILYINVSWEESMRKNRNRFNPDKPDSILEHGLPDKKLENLYSDCDFQEISKTDNFFIQIKDKRIPYVIFENEDDVTTEYKPDFYIRLKKCLDALWEYRN